jgi:hypothetical protein
MLVFLRRKAEQLMIIQQLVVAVGIMATIGPTTAFQVPTTLGYLAR